MSRVVKGLEPTISYTLASVNAHDDPVVRAKAMLIAADAVDSFDPKFGAGLPTHVSAQLRQLNRIAKQNRSPVRIPERVQLDAFRLSQARKRFADEKGREPDIQELSDYVNLSIKRLEKIQKYQLAVPSEEAMGESAQEMTDYESEAVRYVHQDADHTDRRILEFKTGYGGTPVMDPKAIALKLNLTPSQLSRRSMRLTNQINELRTALETV